MAGIIAVFYTLSLAGSSCGRLVVNVEDVDGLTAAIIEKEATLVERLSRETDCAGVTDEVRKYQYFVYENGVEDAVTAELVARVNHITQAAFVSKNESWVHSTITYRPDLNCLDQDDPSLVSRLQEHYLHPPSTKEYNVSMIASLEPESYSQFGQDLFLDKFVFKGQVKEGFFIEAGADDFVHHSNTLWFEMKYQWTGVLVEANPIRFPRGYFANRKAWGAPFCLATQSRPHYSPFTTSTIEGGMSGLIPEHNEEDKMLGLSYDLQCFPLFTMVLALGSPTINYLSLDIEGAEFLVLKSIPWDKVDIEVLVIELEHAGKVFPGSRKDVHKFLAGKGYEYVGTLEIDDVFVRRDLSQGKYKFDFEAAEEDFENYYFNDDEDQDEIVKFKDEL